MEPLPVGLASRCGGDSDAGRSVAFDELASERPLPEARVPEEPEVAFVFHGRREAVYTIRLCDKLVWDAMLPDTSESESDSESYS